MENEFNSVKAQTFVFIYNSITRDYIYKTKDPEPFFEQIREILPEHHEFFEQWLRGFVSVAKNDGKNARSCYIKALEHAESAADYLPVFLQQGFAFFMYINDRENALAFWNFGVQHGLFAQVNEKFLDSFNAKEQFWVQFAPNMCVNQEKSTEKAFTDYKKTSENELQAAIDNADLEKFSELSEKFDFNTELLNGISVLYYAIQRKTTIRSGARKFIEDLVQVQASLMYSKLDLSRLPSEQRNQNYFTILHQVRMTYEKSGLGKIMFNAYYGKDLELYDNLRNLEKIIDIIIAKTDDVDAFTKQIEGKTGSNALFFAAESDDTDLVRKLLNKNSDPNKQIGSADFSMRYSEDKTVTTSIPNNLIYRLISFKSYNTLRMYITEFKEMAKNSMTEKSEKFNITPLVYLILNTIYNSRNEEEFNRNKKIVNEFIPLFLDAGASLEENTAFGTAGKLLNPNS